MKVIWQHGERKSLDTQQFKFKEIIHCYVVQVDVFIEFRNCRIHID